MRTSIDCLRRKQRIFSAGTFVSIPLSAILLTVLCATGAQAQVQPLEIRQDSTRYNLASTNGMPISSTRGTPPGSDGRAPTIAQQQAAGLTTTPPTAGQYQNVLAFGALAAVGRA